MFSRWLISRLVIVNVRIYGDSGDVSQSGKVIKVGIVAKPNDFYRGVFSMDRGGRTLFCSVFFDNWYISRSRVSMSENWRGGFCLCMWLVYIYHVYPIQSSTVHTPKRVVIIQKNPSWVIQYFSSLSSNFLAWFSRLILLDLEKYR